MKDVEDSDHCRICRCSVIHRPGCLFDGVVGRESEILMGVLPASARECDASFRDLVAATAGAISAFMELR